MTRKVVKGYISLKDATGDNETLVAIVWETPLRDEVRIPCILTFDIPDQVEPDVEAIIDERRSPTCKEEALMDRGLIREG